MIESMFKAGAHFAFSKSRRSPTVAKYIFGAKNKVEIFDLEKTQALLEKAKAFVHSLAKEGKTILIVVGKSEARAAVKASAETLSLPFVDGRWIGGTLTNFVQIRKRVEKMERLTSEREKGELAKYTKKERLLIDREIENLNKFFFGLTNLNSMPGAVFVIDSRKEHIAVKEAQDKKIPVIALCGSDNNIKGLEYPIVGNDASISSVAFFIDEIVKAYKSGKPIK